mmetsp:Transcript_1988/g.6012  ORF Transcript_1988/g.6012 Transcript_1988/m.6012 type:complete len:108 (-) Transcript_1988:66-389(-)
MYPFEPNFFSSSLFLARVAIETFSGLKRASNKPAGELWVLDETLNPGDCPRPQREKLLEGVDNSLCHSHSCRFTHASRKESEGEENDVHVVSLGERFYVSFRAELLL